jgi:hypothetical protein
MLNSAEELLVEQLRSGHWKQIQGFLHVDDGYCCLGVACALSGLGEWRQQDDPSIIFYGYRVRVSDPLYSIAPETSTWGSIESTIVLPWRVQKALEWATDAGDLEIERREEDMRPEQRDRISLTELNDAGFTFSQIADVIAAELVLKIGSSPQD